jgi:hypothetical protein
MSTWRALGTRNGEQSHPGETVFQRVQQQAAGPNAIGILLPPGQRTTVIVRPRALTWDLIPIRIENGVRSRICEFGRDEAAGVARGLQRDLENAVRLERDPLVLLSSPAGACFQVGVQAAGFCWIVCPRTPGLPYAPVDFPSQAEAEKAARRLGVFLHPSADARQQIYFNTQHFSTEKVAERL